MFKSEAFLSLVRIFAVAAAMTAGAKIPVELFGAQATLQSFFLCLTALYFTKTQAIGGQVLYLALGWFFPVFSGEKFGMEAFTGYTAGFIFAFPFAAWLMSANTGRGNDWFHVLSWSVASHLVLMMGQFFYLLTAKDADPKIALFNAVLNLLPWAFAKSAMVALLYAGGEFFYLRKNEVKPEVKKGKGKSKNIHKTA